MPCSDDAASAACSFICVDASLDLLDEVGGNSGDILMLWVWVLLAEAVLKTSRAHRKHVRTVQVGGTCCCAIELVGHRICGLEGLIHFKESRYQLIDLPRLGGVNTQQLGRLDCERSAAAWCRNGRCPVCACPLLHRGEEGALSKPWALRMRLKLRKQHVATRPRVLLSTCRCSWLIAPLLSLEDTHATRDDNVHAVGNVTLVEDGFIGRIGVHLHEVTECRQLGRSEHVKPSYAREELGKIDFLERF
mmetsp:Transcript_29387/g.59167  ORF Transcript_29387/g.59167 Transcript_29387/m.59167 type:complete len:248 (+) Transcript_29387:749-1492(+)